MLAQKVFVLTVITLLVLPELGAGGGAECIEVLVVAPHVDDAGGRWKEKMNRSLLKIAAAPVVFSYFPANSSTSRLPCSSSSACS